MTWPFFLPGQSDVDDSFIRNLWQFSDGYVMEIAYDNPTFPDNNPIGIFDQSTKRFLFVLKNDPTKTTIPFKPPFWGVKDPPGL